MLLIYLFVTFQKMLLVLLNLISSIIFYPLSSIIFLSIIHYALFFQSSIGTFFNVEIFFLTDTND